MRCAGATITPRRVCRLVLDVRAGFDTPRPSFTPMNPQLGPTTCTPGAHGDDGRYPALGTMASVEFPHRGAGLGNRSNASRSAMASMCWRRGGRTMRARAGAAHPGDLGGIGISRARSSDDLGRRMYADRQTNSSASPRSICGNLDKKLRQNRPRDGWLGKR